METSGPVIVSGASGLIGQALTSRLRTQGLRVLTLVRRPPESPDEIQWDPDVALDPAVIVPARAVINLNGASIARLPWTRSYRRELFSSRLHPTRTLSQALVSLGSEAPRFLSASAVGFYGNSPGIVANEQSPAGTTYLARLCRQWEQAARAPHTIILRSASVLSEAALLKPLVILARLGLAGPIGPGTQVWPWISLQDEVSAIEHLITADVEGPVNLAGPVPATANQIVRTVAQQLHRPFWLPTPATALRIALGPAAADSLLLADTEVSVHKLVSTGFAFANATAERTIAKELG